MPLKTEGEISFSEIASEFFVTQKPYRLSEFYRGSLKVPDTELNIGVPTLGTIAYSDFYGTAYAIPPTIPAGVIIFRDVSSTEPVPTGWQAVQQTGSYFIKGTSSSASIGTTSTGQLPSGIPQSNNSGNNGAHTGSTFRAGDMGATTGSIRNYPASSNSGTVHSHAVLGLSAADVGTDIPYPPFKRFMLLKSTADTQVLPSDTVVISASAPSPLWTRILPSNDYTYVMAGKDPLFNSGADSTTGISKTYSTTTGTGGAHYHTVSSTTSYYNAGTNTTVYLGQVDGDHDHDSSCTVKTTKMESTYVNLWKAAQTTIAGNQSVFMYEGDLNNLPQDWYLCNGLNGTLDLEDRCLSIAGGPTPSVSTHGFKNTVNELDVTYGALVSRSVSHTHQQVNQFNTRRTYAANINHPTYNWTHSHTAPPKKITTGNVYTPPSIKLGFIQYIKDNTNLSTLSLRQPSVVTVNEGQTVTFTIDYANFPIGSVIYWNTVAVQGNITANDFADSQLSGSITVSTSTTGSVVLSRLIRNDLSEEGLERFRIDLFSDSTRTKFLASSADVDINDTSLPQYDIRVLNYDNSAYIYVDEDVEVEIEVRSTVVSPGTTMYWTIAGTTTAADFTDGAINGSVVMATNGAWQTAIITRTINADATTEAEEYFQIQLRSTSINGTIRATSQRIYIRDTSVTPTYQSVSAGGSNINETASYDFVFEGTNVPPGGELVYWSLAAYDAGTGNTTILDTTDFVETSGSILAPAGTGNRFTVYVYGRDDARTEPNEFFKLSLRRGSTTGTVIAETLLVISITSTSNASYSISANNTSINWGSSVTFTVSRLSGTQGTNARFYVRTTNWDTNDFSTAQTQIITPGANSTTFTVTTRSAGSTGKQGKVFKVEIYNDDPDANLVPGVLIISSPNITVASAGWTGITTSPNTAIVNEGTQITFTVNTEGFSNRTIYWGIDFGSGTLDYGAITQRLLSAASNTEPYRTHFNTFVSGRRAGDFNNDGTVNSVDALLYTKWADDPNSVTATERSNITATNTYITNNPSIFTYGFAGPSSSSDFTTNVLGSGSLVNNQITITYTLSNDALTEGSEKFRLKIYDNSARTVEVLRSTWFSINDTSLAPVINSLTPDRTSANEGVNVSFTANGANHTATNTTYYYRLVATSGTFNASDISATTLEGTLTYTSQSQSGSAVVSLVNDLTTEGVEKFRMDLYSNSTRTVLVASSPEVTVNDTSLSPTYTFTSAPSSINEGSSGTFNVRTTNVANNTRLYWTITNVTTADADFSSTSGNFLISNNIGSFTVTTTADVTTEGAQTFRAALRTSSTTGTVVANSSTVTINDTSLSPTYAFGVIPTTLNEGTGGTFNVNTTNVANGTTLYWTVKHGTTSAADFSATSGNFSITSNRGSFVVTPSADLNTDGSTETFQVEIRTTSTSGTIRATSNSVSVNDTSLTQPGQISRTTSGFTTWVVPGGVTRISVLCIGGGGGGKYSGGGGGAGGNLAYRNNMIVTPGTTWYLRAGPAGLGSASGTGNAGDGGISWFNTSSTSAGTEIFAGGGDGGRGFGTLISSGYSALREGGKPNVARPPTSSNVVTYAGGQGGNGSTSSRGPGGGGAGGYTGTGGRGAGWNGNATAGTNGGGGGGYSGNDRGGKGGGTRIFGSGANGSAGSNVTAGVANDGGAGGAGTTTAYGGGGGADASTATASQLNGVIGAVRVLWPGNARSWPSTRVADE